MKMWPGLIMLFLVVVISYCFYPDTEKLQNLAQQSSFPLNEVASGVFVHPGQHVSFEHEHHDDIANIGFIVGESCVAVIDTGGSVKIAEQLKQSIRTITDKPVCFVINTHIHVDHVLGNPVFSEGKTKFVGHQFLKEAMEANRDFFIEEFADDLGQFATSKPIVTPDILVKDTMEIDLGNRILELRAFPDAHSNTDLVIIDKQTSTIWTGDLLFVDRIPALDGSIKGWLKLLDSLRQESFSRAIPGHGAVVEWPQGSDKQLAYLELLLNQTRKKIEAGDFMEDVVEQVGKQEKLQWLLHEQHHKRNVTKAFAELEWE